MKKKAQTTNLNGRIKTFSFVEQAKDRREYRGTLIFMPFETKFTNENNPFFKMPRGSFEKLARSGFHKGNIKVISNS